MKLKSFDDLRVWLEKVDRIGEISLIEGADWDQDIGCITQLNTNLGALALLFDNIKDYAAGYRVLSSAVKTPARLALTLNIESLRSAQRRIWRQDDSSPGYAKVMTHLMFVILALTADQVRGSLTSRMS